jgi:hypothetical protein
VNSMMTNALDMDVTVSLCIEGTMDSVSCMYSQLTHRDEHSIGIDRKVTYGGFVTIFYVS